MSNTMYTVLKAGRRQLQCVTGSSITAIMGRNDYSISLLAIVTVMGQRIIAVPEHSSSSNSPLAAPVHPSLHMGKLNCSIFLTDLFL